MVKPSVGFPENLQGCPNKSPSNFFALAQPWAAPKMKHLSLISPCEIQHSFQGPILWAQGNFRTVLGSSCTLLGDRRTSITLPWKSRTAIRLEKECSSSAYDLYYPLGLHPHINIQRTIVIPPPDFFSHWLAIYQRLIAPLILQSFAHIRHCSYSQCHKP